MAFKTIYIIDDEELMVEMLAEFVELMGYQPKPYTRASEFFENNSHCLVNSLLILDLNMPEMDGIEVIKQLAKNELHIPLILLSGYDSGILHSAQQLAQAHDLEIVASLTKPLKFNTLEQVILSYSKIERKKSGTSNSLQLVARELQEAIDQQQLVLHYQPQIDLKTGALIGAEALVRWQHPQHDLIYPDSFITLAEKNDLIGSLTEEVINQAVEQMLDWKSKGHLIKVSVNISADNITSQSLPEQLSKLLVKQLLDSSMLILEVTESTLMGELVTSLEILTRLRMKGFDLSIDDFGTGYSSLLQLYRMPFTELKIDQSFVMKMAQDEEAKGIVKTCILLAHELKMRVVAEGVEDKNTLNLLQAMGCDIAQGYYIAKPMPADKLLTCIKTASFISLF